MMMMMMTMSAIKVSGTCRHARRQGGVIGVNLLQHVTQSVILNDPDTKEHFKRRLKDWLFKCA